MGERLFRKVTSNVTEGIEIVAGTVIDTLLSALVAFVYIQQHFVCYLSPEAYLPLL